jgi:hypothetical protein
MYLLVAAVPAANNSDVSVSWVVLVCLFAVVLVLAIRGELVARRTAKEKQRERAAMLDTHHQNEMRMQDQNNTANAELLKKLRYEVELLATQKEIAAHELLSRKHSTREGQPNPNDQHAELNALGAQKMKKELELLDTQLQLMKADLAMRHDTRDYHDLMAEKAKLEIESLKLQIREQHKRLDEFGTFEG